MDKEHLHNLCREQLISYAKEKFNIDASACRTREIVNFVENRGIKVILSESGLCFKEYSNKS